MARGDKELAAHLKQEALLYLDEARKCVETTADGDYFNLQYAKITEMLA
jgi:hypothetical protein